METESPGPSFGKRRVILRTNGKRKQVSLLNNSDSSDLEEQLAKLPLSHQVVDSNGILRGTTDRSTEDVGRSNTSLPRINTLNSITSAVNRACSSDVRKASVTANSHDSTTELFTRHKARPVDPRVHPIRQTLPHNAFEASLEEQQTWPQVKPPKRLPPISTSVVASTPAFGYEPVRSIRTPMSSRGERTMLLSSPEFNCSGPLQPLLTASARKGGRIASADTDWSFDGESQLESVFPDKQISVYIATWNMHNEKELPASLDDLLLPQTSYTLPELYVIGTEETSSRKKEWEILIQQTIGPSHVLLQTASLGSLHLVLFVHRDLLWYCSGAKAASFATRPFSQFKTKGAVGLMFNLFGTSFLFITCHLTAHQQKIEERNSDYKRISSYFSLPETSNDKVSNYDYVFWLGDLNYRIDLSREECNQLLMKSNILELLMSDQLTGEILAGNAFHQYSEQPITFFPSYKYDLNSDVYDTSQKNRTPSWTDRILFRSRDNRQTIITGHGYYCCDSIRISDHRPVYAYFKVRLKPCNTVDGILDVVTTFDAEIYNKANQRRKNNAEESLKLRQRQSSSGTRTSSSNSATAPKTVTSSYCTLL